MLVAGLILSLLKVLVTAESEAVSYPIVSELSDILLWCPAVGSDRLPWCFSIPCLSCVVLPGEGHLVQPGALCRLADIWCYVSLYVCVSSVFTYMIALDFGGLTAIEDM